MQNSPHQFGSASRSATALALTVCAALAAVLAYVAQRTDGVRSNPSPPAVAHAPQARKGQSQAEPRPAERTEAVEGGGATPASPGDANEAWPTVRLLENGDREVILLDGLRVIQPASSAVAFGIFRADEPNRAGLPSGILPDGRYVFENMVATIEEKGRKVEVLTRYCVTTVDGPIRALEEGEKQNQSTAVSPRSNG